MKLRIQGNSLRFRVSKSDLARFVETGALKETVCFGREESARLTYSLVRCSYGAEIEVESSECQVTVLLRTDTVLRWSETDQVGISGDLDLGSTGILSILVEKDFACLDRSDADNADSFPNPLAPTHAC